MRSSPRIVLTSVGSADNGDANGLARIVRLLAFLAVIGGFDDRRLILGWWLLAAPTTPRRRDGFHPERRQQFGFQFVEPLSVLGGDRDRLTKPKRVGLIKTFCPGARLALVGDEHDRPAGRANDAREGFIGRRHTGAGVKDKGDDVGFADR
jgi:hypothetical protein